MTKKNKAAKRKAAKQKRKAAKRKAKAEERRPKKDIAALNQLKAGKGRNRMDEGWAMAHPHKNALDWAQMTSDEQKDAIRIYKIGSMAKLEIPNDISWSVREHDLDSK